MAYNKNFNINSNSVANISGSIITLTGSLFGSQISGTTAQFTAVSASNITASELNIDYIDFVTGNAANPTFQTGRLYYDINTNDLQFNSTVNNVSFNLGQQLVVKVKNDSLTTINKGKLVRINGGLGNNPTITTASWENDANSANTLGMMMNTAAHNDFGYVILNGVLIGVDTSTFSAGQPIYLSSSGDYTNIKPVAPIHNVKIGEVVRVGNSSVGSVFVNVQNGYELEELHNVLITSASQADLIVWDTGSNVWKNSKTLSGSYTVSGNLTVIGTISASNYLNVSGSGGSTTPGGTNTAIQFNSGSTFSGSSNLIWDYTNNRLGIGATSPTYSLDIQTSYPQVAIGATGSGGAGAIRFRRSDGIIIASVGMVTSSSDVLTVANNNEEIRIDASNLGGFISAYTGIPTSTERLRITQDGKVGIGATSPGYSLDVQTSYPQMALGATGSGGAGALRFRRSDGNVVASVGMTGASSDVLTLSNANEEVRLYADNSGGFISAYTGNPTSTERLRITPAGNVGIGKTTPNSTLDVNGNVIITGSITTTVTNSSIAFSASNSLHWSGTSPTTLQEALNRIAAAIYSGITGSIA